MEHILRVRRKSTIQLMLCSEPGKKDKRQRKRRLKIGKKRKTENYKQV